ncbi:MAG TPA: hypothetical protein VJ574_05395 [Candidatus Bathyarchaeia archaeon]|nr:hypothetical protein [Candidatus Bathyarchaeia archaeon]
MEGRPVIRASRGSGRRSEKTRAKSKKKERQPDRGFAPQEKLAQAPEELVNRTLNVLRNLGSQRFALPPFDEYVVRWLSNLKSVLYEFESNPATSSDDQFARERSQILSEVELNLVESRQKEEASGLTCDKSLSDAKGLLERIEEDYIAKKKDIETRNGREILHLSSKVDKIKEEIDNLTRTKTGIFGVFLKSVKARREAEALQRLESARRDVVSAEKNSIVEKEKLRNEFEGRRQPVNDQIRDLQRKIEEQEVDGSVEIRRAACDSLINSVNALLQRNLQMRNP